MSPLPGGLTEFPRENVLQYNHSVKGKALMNQSPPKGPTFQRPLAYDFGD